MRPPHHRPPPSRKEVELPPEVALELDQVARFGKSGEAKDLLVEGSRFYEEESFSHALGPALRAKGLAPRSASVRELLGLVYYRLGRWREAARELSAYKRMSDRRDEDHIYADCERALGKPERALEILEGIGQWDLGEELSVEGLLVAAGALSDLERHGEAVITLMRGPTDPHPVREYHLRLWYALGDALERAGRRPEARQWWDLVYAEDPDFFDVASRRLGSRQPTDGG